MWNPSNFTCKRLCGIIYGCSGSGKTVVCSDLLEKWQKHFDEVYLISPTSKISQDFPFIKSDYKIDPSDEDWLEWIETLKVKQEAVKPSERKKVLIIFDDINNRKEVRSGASKTFESLPILGRHYNIHMIYLLQNSNLGSISTSVRNNANLVICRCRSRNSKKVICEEYIGGRVGESESLLNQATMEPYSFCVIDLEMGAVEDDASNYVYSYKTSNMKPFKKAKPLFNQVAVGEVSSSVDSFDDGWLKPTVSNGVDIVFT